MLRRLPSRIKARGPFRGLFFLLSGRPFRATRRMQKGNQGQLRYHCKRAIRGRGMIRKDNQGPWDHPPAQSGAKAGVPLAPPQQPFEILGNALDAFILNDSQWIFRINCGFSFSSLGSKDNRGRGVSFKKKERERESKGLFFNEDFILGVTMQLFSGHSTWP